MRENTLSSQDTVLKRLNKVEGLGRHSIYSTFLEAGAPENISFHHLLTRLMTLIQTPLQFAILDKTNGRFRVKHVFNNDPAARSKLIKFLISFLDDKKKSLDEYLFPILLNDDPENQNNYLLSLRVTHKDFNSERYMPIEIATDGGDLCKRDISNVWTSMLSRVLKSNDSLDLHMPYYEIYVLNSLSKVAKLEKKDDYRDTQFDEIHQRLKSTDVTTTMRHGFDHIFLKSGFYETTDFPAGPLNESYNKIVPALNALSRSTRTYDEAMEPSDGIIRLPNFLFYSVRALFGDEKPRFYAYNYGLRIMLCSRQESQVRSFLESLSKVGKEGFSKVYFNYSQVLNHTSAHFGIAKRLDAEFWSLISENNYDEIIRVLSSDFGENYRDAVDPCICNRYMHYMYAFEAGGLNRIVGLDNFDDSSSIENLQDKDDAIRIVIAYYLWFGMMSDRERKNFSVNGARENLRRIVLMTVPIEIQGTIYGAVSHFSHLSNTDHADLNPSARLWHRNFTFYHSVVIRFRRKLRVEVSSMFYRLAEARLASNLKTLFAMQNGEFMQLFSLDNINAILNANLNEFCSLVPLPLIRIEAHNLRDYNNQSTYDLDLVPERFAINVHIEPTPFFLKLSDQIFVSKNRLVSGLYTVINSVIVELAQQKLLDDRWVLIKDR